MVFEGRIAEMLQNQASRFLRGFSAEQLKLGLLSGRLELCGLALNAEPLDALLLESEIPLVMKAGVLTSAVTQIALLQGELELVIDGLILVLGPACRWLTRTEVFAHRLNEIQRLEFVHMRSQCQRRTLEREMFRQLFSDYLSRLKISVRNVHIRIEVEGEVDSSLRGRNSHACFGIVLGSCDITPVKGAVAPPDKDKDPSSSELLLAEKVSVKGLTLYHEAPDRAKLHIKWATYYQTRNAPLGVFDHIKQDQFVKMMDDSRAQHAGLPASAQLMPPATFSVSIDMRSQPIRDGFHVDSCLTMEITVCLAAPSRLHFTMCVLEHLRWFIRRTLDFQLWQFMHPVQEPPRRSTGRWHMLRSFVALKRRIHANNYALSEAITMRIHCKEYVRLYKKKFNGPGSVVQWRKSLPSLTHGDAVKLSDIELVYPADKLVNFRLMAHAELKTEMALNSFLNSDDGGVGGPHDGSYRRAARELTPLEQLHLHGQHGYGVNIYRGLPPPPSSLKIRIDIQAPEGLWWICRLSGSGSGPNAGKSNTIDNETCWTVALDCAAQPVRVLLVDSIVDASVFATIEVPKARPGQRPCGILLGRSAAAFANGSPGRTTSGSLTSGGKGMSEWASILELHGPVYVCSQLKTVLTSSPNSPWDIFVHFSCGDSIEIPPGGHNPLEGFGAMPPPQRYHTGAAGVGGDGDSCLNIRIPFVLASGQAGPLMDFLAYLLASIRSLKGKKEIRTGPSHSSIAWLARRIGATRDIAVFRLHVRLPPAIVEGCTPNGPCTQLPRFDHACHLEHGGLVDGFVVGLHHLRHFTASLATATSPMTEKVSDRSSGSHRGGGATPWALQPLEQAPPAMLITSALAVAFTSVSMAGAQQRGSNATAWKPPSDAGLLAFMRKSQLVDIIARSDGPKDTESPIAAITLTLVMVAVMIGRRLLWDQRDSQAGRGAEGEAALRQNGSDPEAKGAGASVTEIHLLAGSMLRALLIMGFPLHPRCLQLAAWAGALEILEAVAMSRPSTAVWPPNGLLIWTARGAYANLQPRQEEVVRYLLQQQARIDECDKGGRSLLDWACWSGAKGMVALALRAGLLPAAARMPSADATTAPTPSDSTSPPQPPTPPPLPPSPLTLAVASRSSHVVGMLLRAAGDPHAPPRGGSCGPLLLALRTCEYDIGCQVLRGAAFVSIDGALGAQLGTASVKGDHGDGVSMTGCTVRATIAMIDSLRRFAGWLTRRSAEDAGTHPSSMRSNLPGPHPDEGLYSTAQMPFSDILHPLAVQLPLPLHKVGHEFRPHTPPHRWLRRGSPHPWAWAHRFIDCCMKKGFRPDSTVVARALPALPPDARCVVQELLLGGSAPGVPPVYPSNEMVTPLGSPVSDAGPQPTWFGAVLANEIEDRKYSVHNVNNFGAAANGIPERNELSAAISFAKEIRELRSRPQNAEGLPPLDIAAALGVDGGSVHRDRDRQGPGHSPVRMPQPTVHRMSAGAGPPSMWVSVSLGGGSPVIGRAVLDGLRIDSTALSVKAREQSGASRSIQAFLLCEIGAVRQFELSGAQGYMENIVEVRLRPEADVTALADSLFMASGSQARTVNGGMMTQHGHLAAHHVVSLIFARADDSEQFAVLLQACWQNTDLGGRYGGHSEEDGRNDDEVSAFLQGGPWDSDPLHGCLARSAENLSKEASSGLGSNGAVAPPPAQVPPAQGGQALPRLRAVIIGAPRVGKTRVAQCLASDLAGADLGGFKRHDEEGSAWIGLTSGTWPGSSKPRAEVHIWDGSAAPLPGMVSRISAEPSVPLLIVAVVDAAFVGLGVPSEAVVAASVAEASSSSSSTAPRRMFVVENVFLSTPGASASSGSSGSATSRGSRTQTVRCSLQTVEGCAELRRALGTALGDLVAELEARTRPSLTSLQFLGGPSGWGAAITARPPIPLLLSSQFAGCGDPVLAGHVRGDSVFLHPSAVSWAWATVRAAQGYLAEGCFATGGGGALVPWERLERVLNTASSDGAAVAPTLLRTLADLGLVCPVPAMAADHRESQGSSLGCTWVLIPDFARRVRLASANSLRHACGLSSESSDSTPGVSARLMWDAPTGAPSLRGALRDFLSRGLLGSPGGDSRSPPSRWFEVRSFVLLEAGPTGGLCSTPSLGVGGSASADGLLPGFILVFDLATASKTSAEGEVPQTNSGAGMTKPPASVVDLTPSGARNTETPRAGSGAASMTGDDDLIAAGTSSAAGRLTAIAVGASTEAGGRSKSSSAAFWDVHCVGPHAQWACRALLGTGANGPGFIGYRRVASGKARSSSSAASSTSPPWPMPAPACVLSQVDEGGGMFSTESNTTPAEFVGLSWLFNAPSAMSARAALGTSTTEGSNPIAECCAALCGKAPTQELHVALQDTPDVPGLSACAAVEAALLSRNMWEMPRLLDEVLTAGAEAWSLLATSFARVAHDAAAEAAGSQARHLPLLAEVGGSSSGTARVVGLVPEGPPPVAAGLRLSRPGAPLGSVRMRPGVEAWLRLCRPLALWSAAGSARGLAVVANELQTAGTGNKAGEQVSEALRTALSVKLTGPMVAEVWDALAELEVARTLVRRACGTWAHVDTGAGFLL